MSEARERYYKLKSELEHLGNEGLRGEIDDYVTELEQQLSELKESQKQKQIIKLCERLDEAKQQNKQMLEALIDVIKYGTSGYIDGSKSDIEFWFKINTAIETVTGKPIDELLQ